MNRKEANGTQAIAALEEGEDSESAPLELKIDFISEEATEVLAAERQRVSRDDVAQSEQRKYTVDSQRMHAELKLDLAKLKNQLARLRNKSFKANMKARKQYANRIFCLISFWLVGIFGVIVAQGHGGRIWFRLSDGVLITLITTTTATVFGLFVIVATYLFPKNGSSNANQEQYSSPELKE